jgi:Calcium binding
MGWYYYLEDKIQFPFHAQCIASVPTSPVRKGDSVEIRKMAPEDFLADAVLAVVISSRFGHDFLCLVRFR